MIPLRDDNPTYRKPLVTWVILAICIVVFFLQVSSGMLSGDMEMTLRYGFIPAVVNGQAQLPPDVAGFPSSWTIVTSMFLHGGWMHLIGNMLFLYIFADNVEDVLGSSKFITLYLLSGLGAALFQYASDSSSTIPMIGASGAISGVLGAYLILFPKAKVLSLIFLGFFATTMRIAAGWFLGGWFAIQGISAMMSDGGAGVAWWAHIGGFIVGMLALLILKPRNYLFGSRRKGPWH